MGDRFTRTMKAPPAPPVWARRANVAPSGWREGRASSPRVSIVGPCAAGKSTLVARLQARGVDAYACAQEHSGVPYLWQLAWPDLLLFLDANRKAIAARRGMTWPASLDDAQRRRLAPARMRADAYLDTSDLALDEVVERAMRLIEDWTREGGS